MNKVMRIIFAVIFLVIACGFSFWSGMNKVETEKNNLITGLILNDLGNTLLALRYFDKNQPDEARVLLEAETDGQLGWLITLEQASNDQKFVNQRCQVLNTLKWYRNQHPKTKTIDSTQSNNFSEIKVEEEKRIRYLANLACGTETFFKN